MISLVPVLLMSISLGPLFTDHAVLQRGHETAVFGHADPQSEVMVRVAGIESTAIANAEGFWKVTLDLPEAGGPHELAVTGKEARVVLTDIMIGDVYLCSGQSNMQWPLEATLASPEEIERVGSMGDVRLFPVPKNGSAEPVSSIEAQWVVNSPGAAESFSAVALYFAEELRSSGQLKGVPLGLIDSSYGGTMAEGWISAERVAANHLGEDLRESMFGWKPSQMYNGMITPLVPASLRGVLWYQGESNSSRPVQYSRLVATLVEDWRECFRDDDLPFFVVQLPNFAERFDDGYFTWIREAQARASGGIEGVHLAVGLGTTEGFDLHPKEKAEIGRRLGLLARHSVYGESDLVAHGPKPTSFATEGNAIIVEFDSPVTEQCDFGEPQSSGVFIAGSDGVFVPALTDVEGRTLRAHTSEISQPQYIRYAWETNPSVTLHGKTGLPVAPFRNDEFPPPGLEIERMPAPWKVDTGRYVATLAGDGRFTSFRVGVDEFLDSSDPFAPGMYFNSVWGPARLFGIRQVSDRRLKAEMEFGGMAVEFQTDSLRIRLWNRNDDPLEFLLNIRENINLVETEGDGGVTLRRGQSTVTVGSSTSINPVDVVPHRLRLEIPPRGEASLELRVLP